MEVEGDIILLAKIVEGLRRKAENTGKYGFFEYQRDLETYKQSVDRYTSYGSAMNRLMTGLS